MTEISDRNKVITWYSLVYDYSNVRLAKIFGLSSDRITKIIKDTCRRVDGDKYAEIGHTSYHSGWFLPPTIEDLRENTEHFIGWVVRLDKGIEDGK